MLIDHGALHYLRYLSFPKFDEERARAIMYDILKMGIIGVESDKIIGKGHKSVVIRGLLPDGKKVAIKVLRTDTMDDRLANEAKFLRLANSIGVGPKLIAADKHFVIMEMIQGMDFANWLDRETRLKNITKVVLNTLIQTAMLDLIGLDHGELSNPHDHLIVSETRVTLLDFESASTLRRPKNFTSFFQYVFIRSRRAVELRQLFNIDDLDSAISMAQSYRKSGLSDAAVSKMIIDNLENLRG